VNKYARARINKTLRTRPSRIRTPQQRADGRALLRRLFQRHWDAEIRESGPQIPLSCKLLESAAMYVLPTPAVFGLWRF
jgi:hypothetical protein